MGDMGDHWKETKELRKQISRNKKSHNGEASRKMLTKNKIEYEEKSDIHLVVTHNGKIADLWPTTGKFCIRGSGQYKRGVRLLIKLLNEC